MPEAATEQAFMNRYFNDYLPRVTRLAEDANLPNISKEIDDFVAKTGLPDPRLKSNFNLESAKHEIVSHMRPYNAGFAPDYRNLQGLDANPVSPFNERLATQLDGMIADNYTQGKEQRMFTPRGVQGMFEKSGFENMLQSFS